MFEGLRHSIHAASERRSVRGAAGGRAHVGGSFDVSDHDARPVYAGGAAQPVYAGTPVARPAYAAAGAPSTEPAYAAAAAPAANGLAAPALPSSREVRRELDRERYRQRFAATFRSTIFILVVVAALAVLVAVLLLPVLRIYGTSMHGTLDSGDVVVSVKTSDFKTGDVAAFYYNNNILVKRVIAQSGDWVDIDDQGNVYVNNQLLDEPYLSSKAYGQTNIDLPYQVPDGKIFMLGDNREVSIDSRNTAVGCVSQEQIVGKIVFRLWPFGDFGPVS